MPVHHHITREPTSAARVRSLAATGAISTTSLWQAVGAVAVNSHQAFAAQELIVAKNMKDSATKAAAKAAADLLVVTEAEALAASDKEPKDMSDAELTTAVKFVYVAKPEQPAVCSSIKGKGEKVAFLSGLNPMGPCRRGAPHMCCRGHCRHHCHGRGLGRRSRRHNQQPAACPPLGRSRGGDRRRR